MWVGVNQSFIPRLVEGLFDALRVFLLRNGFIVDVVLLVAQAHGAVTVIAIGAVEAVFAFAYVGTIDAVVAIIAICDIQTLIAELGMPRETAVHAARGFHAAIQIHAVAGAAGLETDIAILAVKHEVAVGAVLHVGAIQTELRR